MGAMIAVTLSPPPGAEQVAEKPRRPGEYPEKHPAGAEAQPFLSATYGTTEVVP
jgi:hypothetical protein